MNKQKSTKTLKEYILKDLQDILTKKNFKLFDQQFEYKKTSTITYIIHLMFQSLNSRKLIITTNIALRHVEIEEIANSWRIDLPEKEKKRSATICSEIGKIIGVPTKQWEISKKEQSIAIASDIYKDIREYGFPFLERFSDLHSIERCFLSDDWHDWGGQLSFGRALRLPTIYLLLGDIRKACNVIRSQFDYLKSIDDLLVQDYPTFIKSLSNKFNFSNPLEDTL